MDALIFDAELRFDLEAMPIDRIVYWYERAVLHAQQRQRRQRRG